MILWGSRFRMPNSSCSVRDCGARGQTWPWCLPRPGPCILGQTGEMAHNNDAAKGL